MDRIDYLEKKVAALEEFVLSLQKQIEDSCKPVVYELPCKTDYKLTSNEIKSYTVNEAAEKLSVSVQTIRLWLRTGLIKGSKIGDGRVWRITEDAIYDHLQAVKQE